MTQMRLVGAERLSHHVGTLNADEGCAGIVLLFVVLVVVALPVTVGAAIYNAAGLAGALPYSVFVVLVILTVIGAVANRSREKKAKAQQAKEQRDREREADAMRREEELARIAADYEAEVARQAEAAEQVARQLPPPRLIKNPLEAEVYARDVLDALRFRGLRVTPYSRDGGVDVRGDEVVAQVKMEGIRTPADRLQALNGIAAHEGKHAAFFSLAGYTTAALTWGEAAGIALFEFQLDGSIGARSTTAEAWLATLAVEQAPSPANASTPEKIVARPIPVPDFTKPPGMTENRCAADQPLRASQPCAMPGCKWVGPVGTCPTHDMNW